MDRMFSTAERNRNLVTFTVGHAIPMAIQLASQDFLHSIRMEAQPAVDPPRAAIEGDLKAAEEWYTRFRRGYAEAQLCLDRLNPWGAESRSMSLVGEAMWTSDVEERFFYSWRALEVIGNLDLQIARRKLSAGELEPSELYLRAAAETLLAGQTAKIDTPARVQIAIAKRFPEVEKSRVEYYYDLRNAIAHGDVSAEQHLEILKSGPEIHKLAFEAAKRLVPEASNGTIR